MTTVENNEANTTAYTVITTLYNADRLIIIMSPNILLL